MIHVIIALKKVFLHTISSIMMSDKLFSDKIMPMSEMQLIVGSVGPRGQKFRGSGKRRLCVRSNDRQTFLLLGAVKNEISVGPGYYLLDP